MPAGASVFILVPGSSLNHSADFISFLLVTAALLLSWGGYILSGFLIVSTALACCRCSSLAFARVMFAVPAVNNKMVVLCLARLLGACLFMYGLVVCGFLLVTAALLLSWGGYILSGFLIL